METMVDIPEDMIKRLDRLSETERRSRNELMHQALVPFLQSHEPKQLSLEERRGFLDQAFGALRGRVEDGQAFQDRMRSEWERD